MGIIGTGVRFGERVQIKRVYNFQETIFVELTNGEHVDIEEINLLQWVVA